MKQIFLKTSDNIKIAVNHYLTGSDNVIIICPGWFMTKDSKCFRDISDDLSVNFDVITMDFRGHGKSGGFYTFTAKEESDLTSVIKYAKECGYLKIFLTGFSLGGAIVLNYGAKHEQINGIIAVSAPVDFMKIENRMYSPDAWIPTLFKKFEPLRWITIRAGFPFYKKENPVDMVSQISVPTLFIAGGKDPTVLPWHTETLYRLAQCKKDYKLFKNSRHAEDLYMDFPHEFVELCTKWFNEA